VAEHSLIRTPSLDHHADQAHMDRNSPGGIAQENSQIELELGHNPIRIGRQISTLSLTFHFDLDREDRS